jgi:hypothetical protein
VCDQGGAVEILRDARETRRAELVAKPGIREDTIDCRVKIRRAVEVEQESVFAMLEERLGA